MCRCDALIKAIDAYISKADDDLQGVLSDAGFLDTKGAIKEISSLELRVADALKSETAYITTALENSVDLEAFAQEVWPRIQLTDDLADKLRLIFVDEFSAYMPDLISQYAAKIDPELVVSEITQRTTSWIQSWSSDLAEIMKLNSHKEIDSLLAAGLEKRQGVAEFTQSILDSGIRDEYYKARRVAITETLRSHSYAQQEALVQSPAAEAKEWVHTGAYRNDPRQNHVALSGVIVPVSQPFELAGADGSTYYPQFPRDTSLPASEAANCHCIHRAIVSKEILGLPLEERQRLQAEAIAADNGAWEAELDALNRARAGIES